MSFCYTSWDANDGQTSAMSFFFFFQLKNFVCFASLKVSARLINSLYSLHLASLNGIQDFVVVLKPPAIYMKHFSSF